MHDRNPLYPETTFHILNHAVGTDNLFHVQDNYRYFLQKYAQHVAPVVDTFAYCLMPNHFHLAIRVKSSTEIMEHISRVGSRQMQQALPKFQTLEGLPLAEALAKVVAQRFSNFFSSYAQAYNKQQGRKGNLFRKPLIRKPITDHSYFQTLIHYVHHNPVHHGFTDNLATWPHSSYSSMLSCKPSLLCRSEVLETFGDRENYMAIHQQDIDDDLRAFFDEE